MAEGTSILDRVIGVAENQKSEEGSVKSWWRWPLVILLVLIALAIFAWISRRDSRELAELRHAKKKAEVKRDQADSDVIVATELALIAERQKEIDVAIAEMEHIDLEIEIIEARLAERNAAIDNLRSWDDVSPGGASGG